MGLPVGYRGQVSLLDEAKGRMKHTGPACTVAVMYATFPDAKQQINELLAEVVAERIYASVAGAVLRDKLGADVRDEAIRRHTRGHCRCH